MSTANNRRRKTPSSKPTKHQPSPALVAQVIRAMQQLPQAQPASALPLDQLNSPTRFTKLNAQLQPLKASVKEWAAVHDTVTGLMIVNRPLERLNHKDATAHVEACSLGGKSDWRLPTRAELVLLVDDSRYNPAVNTDYLPHIKAEWHWTSTPDASDPACAWFVDFGYGLAYIYLRYNAGYALAVRRVAALPGQ